MELVSGLATAYEDSFALGAFMIGILTVALVVALAIYLYRAFALMTIARKTDTPLAWLAFIPIGSEYLTWRISRTPMWTLIVYFGLLVTAVFGYVLIALSPALIGPMTNLALIIVFLLLLLVWLVALVAILSYWWWHIASRRGYPGAVGLLMSLPYFGQMIPYLGWVFGIVPLVTIGILAWRDP